MNTNQYVLHRGETWMVRNGSGSREMRSFTSRMDAMYFARTMAAEYGSDVIVFDEKLNIVDIESYARKPDRSDSSP